MGRHLRRAARAIADPVRGRVIGVLHVVFNVDRVVTDPVVGDARDVLVIAD